MTSAAHDFGRLSISERIQLVEDLWDSIAASGEEIPLTSAEVEELNRRLAQFEANPAAGAPWDEVRARVEERLRLCR